MQDDASAKKLTIAPNEVNGPRIGTPYSWARVVSGAPSLSRVVASPSVPCTSTYVMKTKKEAVMMRLQMMERGMVLRGLTASSPKAVELSKPTKLNMATTTPMPKAMSDVPFML